MLAIILALLTGAAQPAPPDCAYDRAAMLAMDFEIFDQTYDDGWRTVGNVEGCELAAAELIADWRAENAPEDQTLMRWHEGQLRAAAGDIEAALESMKISAQEEEAADNIANLAYKRATIAYLEQDRAALSEWREKLAALPKPDEFDAAADKFEAEYGWRPVWPSNLNVVDGLIACFDKPYGEAYSTSCQPGGPPGTTP